MRLIDCTYFTKGERIIQNAPATPTPIEQNQIAVKNTIDGFILSLQDEFLCGMVGYTVMKLLLAYAETGAMEEGDEDYDAELSYLLDAVKEPFADFVMYRILRATITHATTTGTVQLQSGNAFVNPELLMVQNWNNMVKRVRQFFGECDEHVRSYSVVVDENFMTPINGMNL